MTHKSGGKKRETALAEWGEEGTVKGELKHRKLGALGLGEGREGEKEEGGGCIPNRLLV